MRAMKFCVVLATAVVVLNVIFAQGSYEDQLDTPVYLSTLNGALDRFRESELVTDGEGYDLAPGSEGSAATPPSPRTWKPPVRRYTDPAKPLPKMYPRPKTPAGQGITPKQPGTDTSPATPVRPVTPAKPGGPNRAAAGISAMFPNSPPSAEFDEARRAYLKRDYETAVKLFDTVLQKTPGHVAAMYYLANCRMSRREYPQAVALFEKCVQAVPDRSQLYHSLGAAYRFAKQGGKAAAALEKCLELDPGNGYAQRTLTSIYQAAGNKEKVEELFLKQESAAKQAVTKSPENAAAHSELASLYLRFDRNNEEALRLAKRACELKPEYAAYHALQARLLARLNRMDEAAAAIDKAIALDPKSRTYPLIKKQLTRRPSAPARQP